MKNPFRFSDERADAIRHRVVNQPIPWQMSMEEAFADEGYQQALSDLAEKCGENPCPCEYAADNGCSTDGSVHDYPCEKFARYEGQQEGYALAESKVSREILEWLRLRWPGCSEKTRSELQEYLKEKVDCTKSQSNTH